jgi:phosphate uptake regulator
METRKVQLSGGTTYTVSLPKAWAQEHGIEAGSELSLHPNGDGSLLVDTTRDQTQDSRTATIDVTTDSETTLRQRIHAVHAVGFDSVVVRDRTEHTLDRRAIVEDTVAKLSGFELLEATDTRIRLQSLIDAENVDVRKSTLRLRLVMLGMHRDAVSAVLAGDKELAQRVIDRDDEADKLFAMVTRHFRRGLSNLQEVEKLAYTRDELFEYYYTSRQFERVADHAVKIARFTLDDDATVPSTFETELSGLASSARQVIDDAADVILADAGIEAAQSALSTGSQLRADIDDLDRKLYAHDDPAEAYTVGLLLDSIRRTGEYGANVAGVAIQQVARESEPR